MFNNKSQKTIQWQSIFLSHVDSIEDDKIKIKILRDRVTELEKQNKRLKNKISGEDQTVIQDVPVKLEKASDFYKSLRWLKLRFHILSTREKKCALCGSFSSLQVDHVIPRSICPEKAFDEDNLQILCRDCNFGKLDSIPVANNILRKPGMA